MIGIASGSTGTSLSSLHTVDLTGQNFIYVLTEKTGLNIDTRDANGSSWYSRTDSR